jgi:Xaa-Pro dipeptidase
MAYEQYGVKYVGHGVGLEIDEAPLIAPGNNTILKLGVVLAIEPKVTIPKWGGMDREGTVLVTENS